MIAASSSSSCDVTTSLPNKVLPPALKTASPTPSVPKVTCVEVPDEDDPFPLTTLFKNSTDASLNANTLLKTITLLSHSFPEITRLLREWINPERIPEVNNHLIRTILFLDQSLTLQILLQLKEPRAIVRHVDINSSKDKSFLLQAHLTHPNSEQPLIDNAVLLDSGAGGRGYISSSFVDLHNLPCTPLPYQIPVYNVDGTLNKGGAINKTCLLEMKIGEHREQISFHVTDTGSSNVILGLDWLRFHDPLVNWNEGKLFFG